MKKKSRPKFYEEILTCCTNFEMIIQIFELCVLNSFQVMNILNSKIAGLKRENTEMKQVIRSMNASLNHLLSIVKGLLFINSLIHNTLC